MRKNIFPFHLSFRWKMRLTYLWIFMASLINDFLGYDSRKKDASGDSVSDKAVTGWHYPLQQETLYGRPGCLSLSEKHPVGSVPLSSGHVLIRCLPPVFVEPKDKEGFAFPATAWAGLLRVKEKGVLKTIAGLPEFLENRKLFWRTNSFHAS